MTTELVSITSTDKLLLPGLVYMPENPTQKVAVWLHGMGDSGIFYNPDRVNALGEALAAQGIALLAFNNRGAHNSKLLKRAGTPLPEESQRYQGGTYYESIADCVQDIDGAIFFLKARHFSEFYLIGHSTGANKICAYQARTDKNPFSKYVLAGPGDDNGLYYCSLGERRFKLALQYSQRAITAGKPLKVMPRYTGMYPFSAQSAHELLDPDSAYNSFPFFETTTKRLGRKPLFDEYSKLDRPSLVVFGGADEYMYTAGGAGQALDILRKHTKKAALKQFDFKLIPGADHGFRGYEHEFANTVALWLGEDAS